MKWLLRSWLTGRSFIISRDWSRAFASKVSQLLSENHFDVIHVVRPNMFQYVPDNCSARVILDTENVEAQIVRRTFESKPFTVSGLISLFEAGKLKEYEGSACAKADLVLTVTDRDKKVLSALAKDAQIETIPIGVDTEYFTYSWQPNPEARIVFVGTMYWPPNIDSVTYFCRDVLPLIRKDIPEAAFDIVGLKPARTVVELGKRITGVRVTGSVDDVRPYMSGTRVFVVPLRTGSGMRVKILNAMSVGVPVVSTSVGCEGIEGLVPVREPISENDNRDANIWVADSPDAFARAVIALTNDEKLASTLSRNGRKLMETAYDWVIIRRKIAYVYDEIEAVPAGRHRKRGAL